ncbi:unnamed protein product, partial [Iphiclides podalirius]
MRQTHTGVFNLDITLYRDGNLLPEKSARNTVNRSSRSNNLKLADIVDVTLHAFYLPDRYNIIADCLSCGNGLPDWHLKGNVVKMIFKKWGTPQVEFFATSQSTVVPAYASIEAIIFSRDWQYNLARVFPLPPLIPRVLRHLNKSSGTFLVVVPRWESVIWRNDLKRRALGAPSQIRNLKVSDRSVCQPPIFTSGRSARRLAE